MYGNNAVHGQFAPTLTSQIAMEKVVRVHSIMEGGEFTSLFQPPTEHLLFVADRLLVVESILFRIDEMRGGEFNEIHFAVVPSGATPTANIACDLGTARVLKRDKSGTRNAQESLLDVSSLTQKATYEVKLADNEMDVIRAGVGNQICRNVLEPGDSLWLLCNGMMIADSILVEVRLTPHRS